MTLSIIIFATLKPSVFEEKWRLGWSYYAACATCGFTYVQVFFTFKIVDDKRHPIVTERGSIKNEHPITSFGSTTTTLDMDGKTKHGAQLPVQILPAKNNRVSSSRKSRESDTDNSSSSRRSSSVMSGESGSSVSRYNTDIESESSKYNHGDVEFL